MNNPSGNRYRLRFVLGAALIQFAATAFSQIMDEHPVSAAVYEPVSNNSGPSIASDGDGFLVVWRDGRDFGSQYAARISSDGAVLDPLGILLARVPSAGTPGVVWTGQSYLVIWNDLPDNLVGIQVAAEAISFLPHMRS